MRWDGCGAPAAHVVRQSMLPRGCCIASRCPRGIPGFRPGAPVGALEDLEELPVDGLLEAALCVA